MIKDMNRTTIRDIAEKAEVSVGTLYHYYKSKSDMLMSHALCASHERRAEGGSNIIRRLKHGTLRQ